MIAVKSNQIKADSKCEDIFLYLGASEGDESAEVEVAVENVLAGSGSIWGWGREAEGAADLVRCVDVLSCAIGYAIRREMVVYVGSDYCLFRVVMCWEEFLGR